MSRATFGIRDTARDIIVGAQPSGKVPIEARDMLSASAPEGIINMQAYQDMQNQMERMRRQQTEILNANEHARKRLEANQADLQRRLSFAENAVSQKEMEQYKRHINNFENKMSFFGQDLAELKGLIDRQTSDLMTLNKEIRIRQATDNKIATSTQLLDQRMREMHSQLMQLKRAMDTEIADRIKTSHIQADLISRLQDHMKQQEASKNDILANIARRSELDKERLSEEAKKLQDKIKLVTIDVTKNLNEREEQLRDEFTQKYTALQNNIKNQFEARSTYETELNRKNEERWRNQSKLIDDLREIIGQERNKYRERFQKVNVTLSAIEKHMELGNDKIDKIMNAEIQSRKLHEKGLLNKVDEVETQLNNYLNSLTKTVEDVKTGVSNIRIPILDTDALRRDMEIIATDKTKLSMEGLLKLEERITRMQHSLNRDRRELQYKIGSAIERDLNHKLQHQIHKLDDLMDEVESAQNRIRDKVERQVPNDLNELAAKVDNLKAQITNRIDQEEEERYLAIKELQEVYGKIASSGGKGLNGIGNGLPPTSTSLKRDIEECKVAIKKLAESVTTVKNVLDRKVQDEIRRREQDVEVLSSRVDALTIQGLQQQQHQQMAR